MSMSVMILIRLTTPSRNDCRGAHGIMEHPVNPEPDTEPSLSGLDVDIRSSFVHGSPEELVDKGNDWLLVLPDHRRPTHSLF